MEIRTISEAQREALLGQEIAPEDERTKASKTHQAAQRYIDTLLEAGFFREAGEFLKMCDSLEIPTLYITESNFNRIEKARQQEEFCYRHEENTFGFIVERTGKKLPNVRAQFYVIIRDPYDAKSRGRRTTVDRKFFEGRDGTDEITETFEKAMSWAEEQARKYLKELENLVKDFG